MRACFLGPAQAGTLSVEAGLGYIESSDPKQPEDNMNRLPLWSCATVALVMLTACGSVQHHERYAGHVMEANPDMVTQCKLIDTLSSSSGLTGFFAPKGVDNIKQNLLRQADAMGATHVVWNKASVGYDETALSGKAYRCPTQDHP